MNNLKDLKVGIENCHKSGKFRLSSGKITEDYYDLSNLLFNFYGFELIIENLDSILRRYRPDAIGCIELLPTVLIGGLLKQKIAPRGFVVRKQRKDHGTQRLIEGLVLPRDRVALIEDVTSTGASILKAAKVVEEAGGEVVLIITLLDRNEGSRQLLKDYHFMWFFSTEELEVKK